jgi:hypothetical protein
MPTATQPSVRQIQRTNDYDKFSFLSNNRDPSRSHIEALKRAFEDYGNLTESQPVLVNERLQIIDGQHRFIAAQELGSPIFYTTVSGLGIQEARQMNILHKNWTTDDYAESYAKGGNQQYVTYLELKEEFGFSHSVTITYAKEGRAKGIFAEFRNGTFVIDNLELTRERLAMLADVVQIIGPSLADKTFALAFRRAMQAPTYDHARMLKKLAELQTEFKAFSKQPDALRQLEDIYNHRYTESNRVRLY